MKYKDVKDQVLKLLNQYTIAGTGVEDTYNNQKDYILRIPSLVNDAMMEIATTQRRIPVTVSLDELEFQGETEHELWFAMPKDFYQFKSGDVFRTRHGITMHTKYFQEIGRYILVVPKKAVPCDGAFILTYYRYPKLLDESEPSDTEELDNTPDTHRAIPYYVAGMLAMHDDPFLASTLMNGYEDKLAKMAPPVTAEVHPVQDSYDFYHYHEMY